MKYCNQSSKADELGFGWDNEFRAALKLYGPRYKPLRLIMLCWSLQVMETQLNRHVHIVCPLPEFVDFAILTMQSMAKKEGCNH